MPPTEEPASESSSRPAPLEARYASGHLRCQRYANLRTPGAVAIHQVADVPCKLRGGSGDSLAMRNLIERVLQLRVGFDVVAQIVERFACLSQDAVELRPRLGLRLGQRHLYAAMGIHLAFARGFDGQEDHVLEFVDDPRL